MRRLLFLGWAMFLLASRAWGQDVACKIEILHERIQNVDPKVFQTLKKTLTDMVNNRKWTNDNLKPSERIECNFLLTLTNRNATDNVYDATLNIQSSRPVFNSGYNTTMVNYIDREVKFKYEENQTLQFDDNRVAGSDPLASNLSAIMAYYVYLIIGLDYDSFSPKGGEDYFKKALNVVNNAPEEGKSIRGWKSSESNRNRYWILDQILNPRFDQFRPYWYDYHRKGLDLMSQKPEEARKTIFNGLDNLAKINEDNPNSILLQFFFNAKSNEFMGMLGQMTQEERKKYVPILSKMDVTNSAKYQSLR